MSTKVLLDVRSELERTLAELRESQREGADSEVLRKAIAMLEAASVKR